MNLEEITFDQYLASGRIAALPCEFKAVKVRIYHGCYLLNVCCHSVVCPHHFRAALRIVTLKAIDLMNDSKASDKNTDNANGEGLGHESMLHLQNWNVGKHILSEIVSITQDVYDSLGFTTFFLSIGRQIEPHQHNLIFPLPSNSSASSLSLRTVNDLFYNACKLGSLQTSLSALPLFSCLEESQRTVTKLIYHCLARIKENFILCSSHKANTTGEDEVFLGQLFWFGVKLEDAIEKENQYNKESESVDSSASSVEEYSFDSSSIVSTSTATYDDSQVKRDSDDASESHIADFTSESSSEEHQPVRTTPCKTRDGVIEKVITKLFSSADPSADAQANCTEDAIAEAASSFIISGFDDMIIYTSPCTPLPAAADPKLSDDKTSECEDASDVFSVSGAVGIFISHVIACDIPRCNNNTKKYGWKACALVAKILQGDRETADIASACSPNAQALTQLLVMKDFLAVIGHHINNEGKSCTAIVNWLDHLTSDCRRQIHSKAFETVFNLVLLLLLRNDTCHDLRICRATLIGIGLISGHLSGRINELLSETPCDVTDIYSLYATKLEASSG